MKMYNVPSFFVPSMRILICLLFFATNLLLVVRMKLFSSLDTLEGVRACPYKWASTRVYGPSDHTLSYEAVN